MRIEGSMIFEIVGLVEACDSDEMAAAVSAERLAIEMIRKTHGDGALWNYNKAGGGGIKCKTASPFGPSSFCIYWLASISKSPEVSRSL
jgi:hypothetical protein